MQLNFLVLTIRDLYWWFYTKKYLIDGVIILNDF